MLCHDPKRHACYIPLDIGALEGTTCGNHEVLYYPKIWLTIFQMLPYELHVSEHHAVGVNSYCYIDAHLLAMTHAFVSVAMWQGLITVKNGALTYE